jgi:CHAD domain-containing protein
MVAVAAAVTARTVRQKRKQARSLADLIDGVLKESERDLDEEEAVHDLRVACRRLEAGTRLYADDLPGKRRRAIRDTAKAIRRAFDQARDLEVIAAELQSVAGLSQAFRDGVRAANRAQSAGEQAHADIQPLLDQLRSLRGKLDHDEPEPSVLLDRLREHAAQLFHGVERLLPESTDNALHELRIEAKKFRYEMEILRPVYPWLKVRVQRIKRLQDILGRHQDAAVGLHWAEALHPGDMDATAEDRATLMRYYVALRREQRRQLRRLIFGWRGRDLGATFLAGRA